MNYKLKINELPENPKKCFEDVLKNYQEYLNSLGNIKSIKENVESSYPNKEDLLKYYHIAKTEGVLEGLDLIIYMMKHYNMI